MARGWESKSVESQQDEARQKDQRPAASPQQAEATRRRANLQLSIAKLEQDLQRATNERHRAQLESALADLRKQLEALA